MREVAYQILFWGAIVASGGAIVSAGLMIWKIWRHQDAEYERKYQDFLRQKQRVEETLKRT